METRLVHLKSCLTSLKTESEEVWKTLETAERSLLAMLTAKDYDCSGYFGDNAVPAHKPPETVSIKLRADRHETEEFYLTVSTGQVDHAEPVEEAVKQPLFIREQQVFLTVFNML